MGSKKSRKQKRSHQTPKSQSRLFYPALLIFIFMAIVVAGGWLFYHESGRRSESKPDGSPAQSSEREMGQTVSQDNVQKLVGRWRRPDGGYILEIRSVDPKGQMQAAYFNPRPIHVAQARLTLENKEPQIFIELRDAGYPGATYTLMYYAKQDMLAGLYYQPTAGQSFKVVFVRMNP